MLASCSGSRHVVDAERGLVEKHWVGADGTAIALRTDGSFTADHWPSLTAAGVQYGHYQGSWTIGKPGSSEPDAVIITPLPENGDLEVETSINLISDDGDRYVCIETDPDSVCSMGPLREKV